MFLNKQVIYQKRTFLYNTTTINNTFLPSCIRDNEVRYLHEKLHVPAISFVKVFACTNQLVDLEFYALSINTKSSRSIEHLIALYLLLTHRLTWWLLND